MNAKRPGTELTRRDRRGIWLAVAGLVVLLGGLYVAGHFLLGNRLPTGTRIAGVGVGGLTPEQAQERLQADLGPRTKEPLRLYWEQRDFTIEPDEVGLDLRIEESVAAAGGGRTWNPVRMLETAVGADRLEPVVAVDERRLQERIDDIANEIDVEPVEPRVKFRDEKMALRKPEAGLEVSRSRLERLIREQFVQEREPIELPVVVDRPSVTAAEFEKAVRGRVRVAVGAPLTVRVADESFELSADAVRSMLHYRPKNGRLSAIIHRDRFADLVAANTESFRRPAKPATVVLRDGEPTPVADEPGRGVRTDGAEPAVVKAIERRQRKQRVVELGVTRPRSDFRKDDAKRLRITQRIGSFVARFPEGAYGEQSPAVKRADGTVLRPDDVFSLRKATGGSGRTMTPLATAMFNGAFASGMRMVERHPHRVYDDTFAAGRDAMVGDGRDLRFANDSKYGVLVNAWVGQGSSGQVHVEFWSTRRWKVTTGVGGRTHVRKPDTRVWKGKKCRPQKGIKGFDIELHRTLSRDGGKVREDTVRSSYHPQDRIRCRR